MSGVTLIGVAIAVFVVLVSAQVFHDFPLSALTGGSNNDSVAPAKAVATTGGDATTATTGGTLGKANPAGAAAATAAPAGVKGNRKAARHGTGNRAVAAGNPAATADEVGGAPTSESTSPSSAGAETGSSTSGSTSSSGSSGSTSSGSSSSGSNSSSASASSTPTTSTVKVPPVEETVEKAAGGGLDEGVVGTVNGTVGTLDEATGGTLSQTGISGVVENVVESVAGPETVVGKTVNGLGEVVGGLLGGKKSE